MKSILAALVVASAAAVAAPAANAFPALPGTAPVAENADVVAVRDGCGINRHYSLRLERCVWNGDRDFFFGPRIFFHRHFFHHRFYR